MPDLWNSLREKIRRRNVITAPIYSPLERPNHIRLLQLQPRRRGVINNDKISCKLREVALDDEPEYEALSYTLRDEQANLEPPSVFVNGKAFAVTPNLNMALNRLRYETSPRMLWIDAVCINQNDTTERSRQVDIMSQIYSKASRVLIWLSEEVPSDALAFELVIRLHSLQKTVPTATRDLGLGMLDDPVARPSAPGWPAFACLLERRWFRRIWVLQEVVMGKSPCLQCGSQEMPWEILEEVIEIIATGGDAYLLGDHFAIHNTDPLGTVFRIIQLRKSHLSGSAYGLLEVMAMTRQMEATDPRDKVFALLSLARDATLYKADYTKHVDWVFEDFIRTQLEHYSDISLLSHFDRTSLEEPSSVATWAPNWRSEEDGRNSIWTSTFNFAATGDRSAELQLSMDCRALTLRGIIFDEVLLTGQEYPVQERNALNQIDDQSLRRKFRKACSMMEDNEALAKGAYYPEPTLEEAVWRTLICNTAEDGGVLRVDTLSTAYLVWKENIQVQAGLKPNVSDEEWSRRVELTLPLEGAYASVRCGRVFSRTQNNYLGMLATASLPGDIICAFMGARTPFVIRRKPDACYQLIGECYIHGMMYGEILELGLKEEDIVLF